MEERFIGRRDFMKSSFAGLGGFVFLSSNERKALRAPAQRGRWARRKENEIHKLEEC